jgi:hypothetical protein
MPDNTGKSATEPEAKAEATAVSSSVKPVVAARQGEASTLEKLRNAVLTGGAIGFFYALFHSLNISLARGFWWFVLISAVVFIFAIFRRRTK